MNKKLALLTLAAAAFTGTASAQTVMRITGSTAFRGAALTAIRNIIQPATLQYAYVGSSFTGSSHAIFSGTTIATAGPPASPATPVIIKAFWSGSTGGLQTVVTNLTVDKWLKSTTVMSAGGTAYADVAALGANPFDAPVTADVTMADTFQSSTDFKTPVLVANKVGVIVFQWIRNNGAPVGLRNMTPWLATNILSGGTPLSLFTGIPADAATQVYATGRDEESGTRTATFADCLFGSSSSPSQYQILASGGTVTDLILWPAVGVWGEGHSGYASGGTLATQMSIPGSNTTSATKGWLVSYAGINDAATVVPSTPAASATTTISAGAVTAVNVVNGGQNYGPGTTVVFSGGAGTGAAATPIINSAGVITGYTITNGGAGYTSPPTVTLRQGATLTNNGVAYSPTAVHEGQYTFWSYQFLDYRAGYVNAPIALQLATRIKDVDGAVSGTLLGNMKVERAVEGGDVTPL